MDSLDLSVNRNVNAMEDQGAIQLSTDGPSDSVGIATEITQAALLGQLWRNVKKTAMLTRRATYFGHTFID